MGRQLTVREQLVLAGLALAVLAGAGVVFFTRGGDSRAEEALANLETAAPPPAPPATQSSVTRVIADPPPATAIVAPVSAPPPAEVVAEVKGAVRRPGVYRVAQGKRVGDALTLAGGVTEDADLSDINQAARLIDGAPLVIPRMPRISLENGVAANRPELSAADLNPPQYTVSGYRTESAGAHSDKAETSVAEPRRPVTAGGEKGGLVDLNTATREELDRLPRIGPVTADKIIDYREKTPFTSIEDLNNVPGIGDKTIENLRDLVTVSPQ